MSNPAIGLKKTELDTPCLIIDKNILKSNLETMRKHSIKNKVNVRPHCKTHKCSKLAHLQIEYGAIGVSVAKISEAEVLIQKGVPNILITSQLLPKAKLTGLFPVWQRLPLPW